MTWDEAGEAIESCEVKKGHVYKHKATEGLYKVNGIATMQDSRSSNVLSNANLDMAIVVVYLSTEGRLCVREVSEFLDGRFERVLEME